MLYVSFAFSPKALLSQSFLLLSTVTLKSFIASLPSRQRTKGPYGTDVNSKCSNSSIAFIIPWFESTLLHAFPYDSNYAIIIASDAIIIASDGGLMGGPLLDILASL